MVTRPDTTLFRGTVFIFYYLFEQYQ